MRHGTAVGEVSDGAGAYAGATGRVTSSLTVSDDGLIVDRHVGVLFVERQPFHREERKTA